MTNVNKDIIALRMDDVGSSTNTFEVYSKKRFGNFLFLKRMKHFKAWAPFRDIHLNEWEEIFQILIKYDARLTIGITAGWVDKYNNIIPFNKKYPELIPIFKKGIDSNLIELANHGLTHCLVGKHLPKLFSSNRTYHREFYDYLDESIHKEHLVKSQKILKQSFSIDVNTLIPPGNVYSMKTVNSMTGTGLKYLNSSIKVSGINENMYISDDNVVAFHDKEIVLYGVEWLEKKIKSIHETVNFKFIRELNHV